MGLKSVDNSLIGAKKTHSRNALESNSLKKTLI